MPESRLLSIAGAHEVYHGVLTVDNVTLQQKLKDTVRKNTQIMSLIYITDLSITSPTNKVCKNSKCMTDIPLHLELLNLQTGEFTPNGNLVKICKILKNVEIVLLFIMAKIMEKTQQLL